MQKKEEDFTKAFGQEYFDRDPLAFREEGTKVCVCVCASQVAVQRLAASFVAVAVRWMKIRPIFVACGWMGPGYGACVRVGIGVGAVDFFHT